MTKPYSPPGPPKRPIFAASASSAISSKWASMPFEELEVGQSFAVGKDEGINDSLLRSHVSMKASKLNRKFKVKSHKDQGVWEVTRMPDSYQYVKDGIPKRTVKEKTTENAPNLGSGLPWGQQLGQDMDQE